MRNRLIELINNSFAQSTEEGLYSYRPGAVIRKAEG